MSDKKLSHKYLLTFPSGEFTEEFSIRRTIPGIYETASSDK
jgi:hypothetical protein